MSKKIITTWLLLLGGSSAFAANVTWVSFHDTDGPSEATAAAGLTQGNRALSHCENSTFSR